MSRASGSEWARRSSLVTTSSSPARHRGERLPQAGPVAVRPAEAVVDVDPVGRDTEYVQGVAFGSDVLSSLETRGRS
jgi:hypothetical protein